jgi:hypothetical protein
MEKTSIIIDLLNLEEEIFDFFTKVAMTMIKSKTVTHSLSSIWLRPTRRWA